MAGTAPSNESLNRSRMRQRQPLASEGLIRGSAAALDLLGRRCHRFCFHEAFVDTRSSFSFHRRSPPRAMTRSFLDRL